MLNKQELELLAKNEASEYEIIGSSAWFGFIKGYIKGYKKND